MRVMVVSEAEGADCRQPEEAKTSETRRTVSCGRLRRRLSKHLNADQTWRKRLVYIRDFLLRGRSRCAGRQASARGKRQLVITAARGPCEPYPHCSSRASSILFQTSPISLYG